MGLPNINIEFRTAGIAAVGRSQKGVVGLIIKDANIEAKGEYLLFAATDIPKTLGEDNRAYIAMAFTGYVNPPRQVNVFVIGEDAKDLAEALKFFAATPVDYIAGPAGCTPKDATEISSFVKTQRANDYTVKAVLPNLKADSEGVVNLTATEILAGSKEYTAAEYCSRVAGLIAGTPMTISCTYAPLPEVSDIKRHTKMEMDKAIDAGELIFYHDGEKVKIGRGVTSLTTTTQEKGEAFKKIKIVETVDMILADIRRTAQDSFIGKYSNSYDNKCLIITAIKGYFEQLELAGILARGKSVVQVDVAAQEVYLKSHGTDTSKMNEQEIKEAETGSSVFLAAKISILDAVEDIDLAIVI